MGNAADFDPSPACGPPSAEATARRLKALGRRAGGGPKPFALRPKAASWRPVGGRRPEGLGGCLPKPSRRQAAGRKARGLRYRRSTLVLRRDFFSVDRRHNIGYHGMRLQPRRSRPTGKTMRRRRRALQAAWGGAQPGQKARKERDFESDKISLSAARHKYLSSSRTSYHGIPA